MYGDAAVKMLIEIRKSKWLTQYNDDAMRNVVAEIDQLYAAMLRTLEAFERAKQENIPLDNSFHCSVLVNGSAIRRNKRCALTYLSFRKDQVKQLWWDTGAVLPNDVKEKLGINEQRMFSEYDKLMGRYMQKVNVNLIADLEPPQNLLIEVRVLQDYGELQTDTGVVSLDKNTTLFLRRSDCELLIRQGVLIQTSS